MTSYATTAGFALTGAAVILCMASDLAPCAPRAAAHRSNQPIWYTQIGQWRLLKDGASNHSFLFHVAAEDGAVSGQATANVRLNRAFPAIQTFKARMSLGPRPAIAGMLIEDKHLTYYFYVKRTSGGDSLAVYRRSARAMEQIRAAPVSVSDTLSLILSVAADSVRFSSGAGGISMVKLPEFSDLQWVGFECPVGSVKIFHAAIAAQGDSLDKPFEETGLINLHLDKMLPGSRGRN